MSPSCLALPVLAGLAGADDSDDDGLVLSGGLGTLSHFVTTESPEAALMFSSSSSSAAETESSSSSDPEHASLVVSGGPLRFRLLNVKFTRDVYTPHRKNKYRRFICTCTICTRL